jgi:hypothetical protein
MAGPETTVVVEEVEVEVVNEREIGDMIEHGIVLLEDGAEAGSLDDDGPTLEVLLHETIENESEKDRQEAYQGQDHPLEREGRLGVRLLMAFDLEEIIRRIIVNILHIMNLLNMNMIQVEVVGHGEGRHIHQADIKHDILILPMFVSRTQLLNDHLHQQPLPFNLIRAMNL